MAENEFSGEDMLRQIRERSKEKRSNPLEGFRDFLRDIWQDNTEDEARRQWQVKVDNFPWWAEDALYCMDWVYAHPPDNLVELIQQDGWITLETDDELTAEPDRQAYLAWLDRIRREFRKTFDAASA